MPTLRCRTPAAEGAAAPTVVEAGAAIAAAEATVVVAEATVATTK